VAGLSEAVLCYSEGMNPDVENAVPRLLRDGVLTSEQAATVLRVARGELLSVRDELRLLLYGGVLLAMSGVALLVKQNLDRIGPVTIAVALGVAAAACFIWVVRTALPFSWGEQASPNLAFDYLLLLGALLTAADLAYVEVRFTALGASWPWHLLFISLFYAALATRYDSRVLLSLALSTFAAWRGVAITTLGTWSWVRSSAFSIRVNAIGCGVLFVVLGWAVLRMRKKAHFEEVTTHLGWLLVLGGLASGALQRTFQDKAWPLYAAFLLVVSGALAVLAFRAGRFPLFGLGVLAGYLAVARFVFSGIDSAEAGTLFLTVSALALVIGLYQAHRAMKETP
jgi:hypothetical protein